MIAIIHLQRGIPSKRKSSTCIDYVPALCTHRPSLLPIERFNEFRGFGISGSLWIWVSGEQVQIWSFRGSKSRNKVSVGEPAEGSFTPSKPFKLPWICLYLLLIIFWSWMCLAGVSTGTLVFVYCEISLCCWHDRLGIVDSYHHTY